MYMHGYDVHKPPFKPAVLLEDEDKTTGTQFFASITYFERVSSRQLLAINCIRVLRIGQRARVSRWLLWSLVRPRMSSSEAASTSGAHSSGASAHPTESEATKLAPWATGEGTLGSNPLEVLNRVSLPAPPRSASVPAMTGSTGGTHGTKLGSIAMSEAKRRKVETSDAGVKAADETTPGLAAVAAARSSDAVGKLFQCGPALTFSVDATSGMARATTLRMSHGVVPTPVFMPVGTQGTVKGVSPADLEDPALDCRIALGNTYHLGTRPGEERMRRLGGLHKLMGLRPGRCLLTDSGGFQMVSLLHLAEITEKGVEFRSPMDGSKMLLTPERSMRIQNAIGADVLMALDDVVDSKTVDGPRFKEACERTLRWIDRCIAAHRRTDT